MSLLFYASQEVNGKNRKKEEGKKREK